MSAPADLPAPELHPHGTRARYVGAKCRCEDCRAANRAYVKQRSILAAEAADGPRTATHCACGTKLRVDSTGNTCRDCRPKLVYNGPVPAAIAQRHLRKLSRCGVGLRAVHEAADVSRSVLVAIKAGHKKTIRRETEQRILAVDAGAALGGARIDGAPTNAKLAELLEAGFTKTALARRLGSEAETPSLQIGNRARVNAATALRVARLHRSLELDDQDEDVCDDAEYLRRLIANAVAIEACTVSALLDVVQADYGSMTIRNLHRVLASMVETGRLVRSDEGYSSPEEKP